MVCVKLKICILSHENDKLYVWNEYCILDGNIYFNDDMGNDMTRDGVHFLMRFKPLFSELLLKALRRSSKIWWSLRGGV